MLLIVSTLSDVHAKSVQNALGFDRCRIWDPDWDDALLTSVSVGGNVASPTPELQSSQGPIDIDRISAVWYRRPISAMPKRPGRTETYFIGRERDDTLEALFMSLAARGVAIYNLPGSNFASGTKPAQYFQAADHGLQLPETLISNDPAAVRRFLDQHGRSILKAVSLSGLDTVEKHFAVFVSEIDDQALQHMDQRLPPCPVTVQRMIDWSSAARIVVVDERIWCFQTQRASDLDWRLDPTAEWLHTDVPPAVGSALVSFHRALDLRYGCVDMLIDSDGAWWFLETNANGQWLWLEESSRYPLSSEIATAFVSAHAREAEDAIRTA